MKTNEVDEAKAPPQTDAAVTPPEPSRVKWLAWLLGSYTVLGPFSISTYMPFFAVLMVALGATQAELQQTLSVYLAAFGFMMLFHGPLSDAFGRRPVVLVSFTVYLLASIGGAFAASLTMLLFFRSVQGLSVGAGGVVGRAIIRDRLQGSEAQRLLSQVTMVFALGPAIAPVFGGWLHNWFPWQSVFVFLAFFAALQLVATWFYLPETLPREKRMPLKLNALGKSYGSVLKSKPFWLLTLVLSGNFAGFFLYIASAPVFVIQYLGLNQSQFGWLFIPAMSGVIFGAYLSSKTASHFEPAQTVRYGYLAMGVAVTVNIAYNLFLPPLLPWVILPVMLYTAGMSFATPSLTLMTLDRFPAARGMVSSMQGFVQTMVMTLASGVVAPLVAHSGFWMATGMFVFMSLGYAAWIAHAKSKTTASDESPGG